MENVKDILTVIILASTLLLSCFSFSHFPHSSDFFLSYALLLSSVQFSHSFLSDSLRPQALHGASLSITNSQSLLKLTSIELVMPSKHFILCYLLLLMPSIFPASGSFLMSRLFASGGQSIGASASASVLPMNIQD